MRFFVTEYSTEKELFESLENGVEDKIWLFECGEGTDFTIVDVLEKEVPYIGVGVKMPEPRDYEKFMDCLRNKINEYDDGDDDDDNGFYGYGQNDTADKNAQSICPIQEEESEDESEEESEDESEEESEKESEEESEDDPDLVCFIFESKSKRVIISIYSIFRLSFPNQASLFS